MSDRRRLSIVLALTTATALSLAACGSSSTATPAASSTAAAPTSAASSAASSSEPLVPGSANASSPGSSAPASSVSVSASGSASSSASSSASGGLAGCEPSALQTKKAGALTLATDDPAYEPWFADNTPANGKGFESAVAYAVAGKLGFDKSKVSWIKQSFNAATSPAPKNFDFDINEFTITADRAKAVDFSTGYYDVTQAVVTVKGSKIAGAKSVAELEGAQLGAQIGTTSLDALNKVIAPSNKPTVFPTNDKAVEQLKNGQVDGIVVDTPTAFYMASAQLDNGVIVGQLPSSSGTPEQFGLLLDKGSALTSCASKAVDALRADGTLARLQSTWLAQAGAPELK